MDILCALIHGMQMRKQRTQQTRTAMQLLTFSGVVRSSHVELRYATPIATITAFRAQGPAIVRGRAPFSRLLAAARGHGMAVALSRNAGSYVCNYCYWRAIESTALLDRPPLIVFIHVPMLRNRSRPRANATSNAPRRVRLVETGAAILSAVAADLRASR